MTQKYCWMVKTIKNNFDKIEVEVTRIVYLCVDPLRSHCWVQIYTLLRFSVLLKIKCSYISSLQLNWGIFLQYQTILTYTFYSFTYTLPAKIYHDASLRCPTKLSETRASFPPAQPNPFCETDKINLLFDVKNIIIFTQLTR